MITLLIIIVVELIFLSIDIFSMSRTIDKIGIMLAHFFDDTRGDNTEQY